MVKAKAIAEALGVAVSTVGRALADDPRISEATKASVRAVAAELGYIGNVPARVMRGGSSRLVGLIVPDIRNDFYSTIAQELSLSCDAESYQLALAVHGERGEIEVRRVRELLGSRVAGIVIVPTPEPLPETLRLLERVPHVQLLRRASALRGDWFGIDDTRALFDATTHVLEQGHRRIAYVGGSEAISTGRDRLAGFHGAHRAARVRTLARSIMLGPPTATFGFEATRALLQRERPPTAVVYASVQATVGGLDAIARARVAVPKRLSVMGFGDPIWFQWWKCGLSTMRLPMGELARAFGARFLQRLALSPSERPADDTIEDRRKATLVVRGSVRPPPRPPVA